MKTKYHKLEEYATKDGSIIRELMHPDKHDNSNQSLTEAVVAAGHDTVLHKHHRSEELYHVLEGKGILLLDGERIELHARDTVCIKPGLPHKLVNTGKLQLRILCCCTPPYSHEDTELLENNHG